MGSAKAAKARTGRARPRWTATQKSAIGARTIPTAFASRPTPPATPASANTKGLKSLLETRKLKNLAVAGALLCGAAFALTKVDPAFKAGSFVDAVYFLLVSASTVGYGDLSPSSDAGHLIGLVCSLATMGVFGRVILGFALTEAIALFALVVALIILFVF